MDKNFAKNILSVLTTEERKQFALDLFKNLKPKEKQELLREITKENISEDMELIDKINPYTVVSYLEETGWEQFKIKKKYIKVYQKVINKVEFHQITIPIDKTLVDYKEAMFDAIEQIAFLEGQSTEQLMLFLSSFSTNEKDI